MSFTPSNPNDTATPSDHPSGNDLAPARLTWLTELDPWALLAAVRFVLAGVVAVNHLGDYVPLGALAWVQAVTFEAILGFLLISGYAIGASYRRSPDGFIGRRVRRIYPVYLLSMALTWYATAWVLKQPVPGFGELLINLLLLNQVFTTTSFVGPAWSLALECWLYLLTPWLARAEGRRLRDLVIVSFVAYLAYTVMRSMLDWPYYSGLGYGGNLLVLSFAWVAGFRLAQPGPALLVALADVRLLFAAHVMWGAALQLAWRIKHDAVSLFFSDDLVPAALKALLLFLVYTVFACGVLQARPKAGGARWLNRLGDVSYPLFLMHIPVFIVLAQAGWKSRTMYVLGALATACLSLALLYAAHAVWVRLTRTMSGQLRRRPGA